MGKFFGHAGMPQERKGRGRGKVSITETQAVHSVAGHEGDPERVLFWAFRVLIGGRTSRRSSGHLGWRRFTRWSLSLNYGAAFGSSELRAPGGRGVPRVLGTPTALVAGHLSTERLSSQEAFFDPHRKFGRDKNKIDEEEWGVWEVSQLT